MAKAKFVWAKDFMKSVRTSPEALGLIEGIAYDIAIDAGPGHEVQSEIQEGGKSRGRARAVVIAATPKANAQNRKRNVMLQALARAKF